MRKGGRTVREDNGDGSTVFKRNIVLFAKRSADHIPFSPAVDEDLGRASIDSADER